MDHTTCCVGQNPVKCCTTVGTSCTTTHPLNDPLSGTTQVSRYQKGKINLDFTEARDSEWQWHQLGRMQVCTLLQTDNHASTQFFTGPMPFLLPNQQHQSTEGISCTTNREQIKVMGSEGYSRPTCNKLCASSDYTSIVAGVIHMLDRWRVLLATPSTCSGEIF